MIVVLAQVAIVGREYLVSVYPLWTGQRILLAINPVDPRSLFRGNYVQLDYDIGRVPNSFDYARERIRLKRDHEIYIKLVQKDSVWVADGISLTKPESRIFIRGRITRFSKNSISIKYGIEAYFAPLEKAKQIENDMRRFRGNGPAAVAEVMVASSGRAALVGLRQGKIERVHK
jgi:uncharacterized membrane-anchored protein